MSEPSWVPFGPDEWAGEIEARFDPEASEYYFAPLVSRGPDGSAVGRVRAGDCLILALRRGEREVQITRAFADADFEHFPRRRPANLALVTMTRYHETLSQVACAFPPVILTHTLGEVVSLAGLRQLRAAESEKFAHVTRFLNGNRSAPFPGEEHICVPTPHIARWEDAPAMASRELADRTVEHIVSTCPDLVVVNFANGDVVGHTASRAAKVLAAEAVDSALSRVLDAARSRGYAVLVTADHGVLETNLGPGGGPNRGHTCSPVPCLLALPGGDAAPPSLESPAKPALCDVAPTILSLLGLPIPTAMTGRPLFDIRAVPGRAVLVVLDGWGLSPDPDNPITEADTPCMDRIAGAGQNIPLAASGAWVGLEKDKPGNSEAGHLNIGAGRVVAQDDVRIGAAVRSGALAANPVLLDALGRAGSCGGRAHVLGLLSERSSHGTTDEAVACVRAATQAGVAPVFLHLILDGRSSLPGSAPDLVRKLRRRLDGLGGVSIVTAMGRAYALDRDCDWEGRTRVAYEALVGKA
jgi:2,3-bisphosphoglycerate-independent phosphoglycerate mutase